jgi:sec-independent protein translocase protein TatB
VEFLGIGYQELLLVLVLLLIVVGPERLPAMAYQIGRAVRQMQVYARAVRDEFKDEIDYLDEQYKTIRGEVDQAQRLVRDEQAKLNSGLREVNASIEQATSGLSLDEKVVPFVATGNTNPAPAKPDPAPANEPAQPPMVF